jgi:outer membrane protein assembly factor BamB
MQSASATVTFTAPVTTPSAAPSITFTGASASLTHTAALALTIQAAAMTAAPDVTTWHYDLARHGLNSQETILTPSNVNSTQFGKLALIPTDGKVDAQPLFLANVVIANTLHNILYVATEHASVYAFDADTGAQLWHTSALGNNETTSDDHGCSQITPEIGITSTPVIDRKSGANGTLFTVAMSKDSAGLYHQRLHALDLTTGVELSGSPTEISATYPGTGDNSQNGNVVFNPSQYAERAALLLLNGNLYTTWTSHCDIGLYTGWVIAYSESSLQQTAVLNLTPNGHEGSAWMAGAGMAADSNGFIYLLDANGTFDTTLDNNGFPSQHDFGNAMLKLSTANNKLTVADYFESANGIDDSSRDLDLGSAGALLLPDQTDPNGIVHHLIVGGGKDTNIYVADRDNLGKYNPSSTSNVYQQLSGAVTGMIYGSPAYFNGVLYYASDGDSLKAFPITNAHVATSASSATSVHFPHPSATPTISANGTQNGIVWALEAGTSSPAVLHAYDPANLAHEFYNSNQAASGRDSFGNGNKFIAPLIVNGKVYVGTQNGVAVFGLLSH